MGNVLVCLGFPDQALVRSNAAIAEARRLAHRPSLAASLVYSARILSLLRDNGALKQRSDELIAVTTEGGFPHWGAIGAIYQGWVKVRNGSVTQGMSLLRSGLRAFGDTGAENWMTHHVALLGLACEIAGQVDEGLALFDDALQMMERTGERWLEAEVNRHKGRLLLRQGRPESAEELYCKALKIAVAQEAKLWELRATVSLARLWCDQERRREARDLLAPVYGWFTEGFDTADLKDAKALLEELAA